MGVFDSSTAISIWWYIGPVLILTIILFVMLIKRYSREQTLTVMVRKLVKQHEESKDDVEALQKLGGHHQILLLNEVLFMVALLLLIISYLKQNTIALVVGSVIMLMTLYVLQIVMKKGLPPSHHILSLFEKKGMLEEETEIVKHVQALLHKEKILDKKEQDIKKQLEALYHMATTLDGKDKHLRQQDKTKGTDPDVKKVVKMLDDALDKLPEEEIDKFVRSQHYGLYKRVMEKLK